MQINSVDELGSVVETVLAALAERKHENQAAVLALHGDLGAGKTTFMQYLAVHLGVTETVTSPTFVVMKTYDLENQAYEQLVHIDAYRIEELEEMTPLRFSDYLTNPGNLVAIEWAEHIAELLPIETVHVTITIEGEGRNFEISQEPV